MRIGVVGVGMVGEVVKYGMERIGHDVSCHDIKWPGSSLKDVLETDLIFVCVPTPMSADGSCNISIVEKTVHEIDQAGYAGLIVIKSTVTPGTTERLDSVTQARLAFCPEFLKEKSRFVDFIENHDVCIIGAWSIIDFELIQGAHGSLPKQFVWITPTEAETAKYFSNVFNAMRIVFANQFYSVCEKAGIDYTAVKNAVTKRNNISDHYLECNKNFRKFGGNCLPKDTEAFAYFAKQVGADARLFDYIVELNDQIGRFDEERAA